MMQLLPRMVLCLSLTLSAACASKQRGAEPLATATAASTESSASTVNLWRIERPGMPASYLFGTCHMGVAIDEALPREHRALITQAERFVTEASLAQAFTPQVIALFILPSEQSLSTLVGDETWGQLVTIMGGPEAAMRLDRLHPAAASAALAQQLVNPEIEGVPALGMMDVVLMSIAQRSGVPTSTLETPEEQIRALLSGPMEAHIDGLKVLLDPEQRPKIVDQLNAVLDLCRTGDERGVLEQLDQTPEEWRALMFDARNRAWIAKLEALFSEGPTFVAVGAGHLVGPGNVIELLEERGYTAQRLSGTTLPGRDPFAPITPTEWTTNMKEQLPTVLCADGPLADCLDTDIPTCRSAFETAIDTCLQASPLPDPVPVAQTQALGGQLGRCAQSHVLKALADRLKARPQCEALRP